MQFEDEVVLETDPETAWALVSDPEVLVSCVPGAEEVERVSESHYRGTMKRGIAGINVSLGGEVEMTELDPPGYVRADASGEDSNTGSRLDADAEMTMTDNDDGTVTLAYEIDLEFTGRLATVGGRMLKRIISRDIDTFFSNLQEEFEDDEDDEDDEDGA